MMHANELRIGNFVDDNRFGIIQVHAGRIYDFDQGYSIFKPIPLTEEWLLKFGFEKRVESQTTSFKIRGMAYYIHYDGQRWTRCYNNEYEDAEIKYVHQLQNLYFALTGEELKLSEG